MFHGWHWLVQENKHKWTWRVGPISSAVLFATVTVLQGAHVAPVVGQVRVVVIVVGHARGARAAPSNRRRRRLARRILVLCDMRPTRGIFECYLLYWRNFNKLFINNNLINEYLILNGRLMGYWTKHIERQ